IGEVIDFCWRSLDFVPQPHIDVERRGNAEFVLRVDCVFPVPETAIEIPDRNREQVRSAHQEILNGGAPEVREKVQVAAPIIALQVVDLGTSRAPAEFKCVPPQCPVEAGEKIEPILNPHSWELYSGADRSEFGLGR